MYKVFFAEDESAVREIIANTTDWAGQGLVLCGQAADGESALQQILQMKPDILITDIKMPFMDGLELARLVRKEFPGIAIIILSGYGDYEYTHEAIRLGICDYILKPVTPLKLIQALDRAVTQLDNRADDRRAETAVRTRNEEEDRYFQRAVLENHRLISATREKIDNYLRFSSAVDAAEFAADLSAKWYGATTQSKRFLLYCTYELFVTVGKVAKDLGLELPLHQEEMDRANGIDTQEQLAALMEALFRTIIAARDGMLDVKNRLATEAKAYIEQNHTATELSLGSVAAHIGITPNYLSTILSRESGETFTDILNKTRVKRAMALLRSTDKSIGVIGRSVGYSDPYYFSKIFKKVIGLTPREFRKM